MTTEKIIEGNKLIDEFVNGKRIWGTISSPEETMQYHSSWDWLMPVVKKIHEINTVGIAMHYEIDKQWNVVVSFIQWYTQLKPGVSPE